LQPLDLTLFDPLKVYYNAAVDSWLLRIPRVPMTIWQVAECIGEAHMTAMTPANITEGFKKPVIFTYNAHISEESDFLTSALTDCPQETASLASSSSSKDQDISVSEPAPSNIQLADWFSEHANEKSTSTYISPK
jgi:hypothetical protein